ncbi:MFS transporter [Neiella sp. HB171785]|uniref:MFS transporter n=1 Tax=Neiella litorisoli TaxID=2771431 RepID=A0A8J6QMR8_9GAMM|nr:glycoside-pentoside-hexuronide (GPH):cation symporter [Neiella litorisoli]MBD1391076.1 MFS transporter [Neiella litorisoli]
MIKIREKIGYGLGDTAANLVFQMVINFMMFFYTDVYGLSAAAVGTLMLVVRLFDGVTDPIMGGIADRTKTRWGTYRPYLILTAIPYAVLAVLTFTTPDFTEQGKLVYAYVTYALLMTAYTAVNVPYSALGGVLTTENSERTSIQSYRFALAMSGGALVSAFTMPMVDYFAGPDGDRQAGFQMAMGVFAILAFICFVVCFMTTKERVKPKIQPHQSIWKDVASLSQNKPFLLLAAASFILLIMTALRGATTPYYISYYVGREDILSQFLTAGMLASIAGAVCMNWLGSRFCKVAIVKFGAGLIAATHLALYLLPPDQLPLIFAMSMLGGFSQMLLVPAVFAMVADTADYNALKTGSNTMAMSYSGHLLVLKFGIALGGAFAGWILAASGYVANQQQTAGALQGILFCYALFAVITGLAMIAIFHFYKLDDKAMDDIHVQLKAQTSTS